ncbi:hypothetical protein BDW22DRAFT_1348121 [Trametopsis cervina]|nr:hypothetical protein BDW22DRAFT_1348121 [Trametopsis cervina]
MLSFTVVLTALLAATSSFAAPLNSTLHSYGKRDAVCGSDFRSLVDSSSCLPNHSAFTLTPPSTITKVAVTGTQVPADAQCDHTVEIQLLDTVAKKSGLCALITALTAADPKSKKADLLAPASVTISALANLNFLDKTVNNKKKSVVQKSLSGSAQKQTDVDKAVGNYLALVATASRGVATQLDANIATIKARAASVLATLPDGKTSRDKATVVKRDLKEALADFKATHLALKEYEDPKERQYETVLTPLRLPPEPHISAWPIVGLPNKVDRFQLL